MNFTLATFLLSQHGVGLSKGEQKIHGDFVVFVARCVLTVLCLSIYIDRYHIGHGALCQLHFLHITFSFSFLSRSRSLPLSQSLILRFSVSILLQLVKFGYLYYIFLLRGELNGIAIRMRNINYFVLLAQNKIGKYMFIWCLWNDEALRTWSLKFREWRNQRLYRLQMTSIYKRW